MKKKFNRVLILSLVVSLGLVMGSSAFAAEKGKYVKQAEALKLLGLFNGTNAGFELERSPNRVEVAAMLVKFLGAEDEAKAKMYAHPFTDVPVWADSFVGYLYEMKMTSGVSSNQFGSSKVANLKDFTVFLLKALGYEASDFTYDQTLAFAVSKGLFTPAERAKLESTTFKRDEMVYLSYKSLLTKVKGGNQTLSTKLGTSVNSNASSISKSGMTNNYLILTETEAQKTTVQAFKAFKESKGYTVYVKSVEKDVAANSKVDAFTRIEQYLKNTDTALSLDYVLLIGDPYNKTKACPQNTGGVIPMRYLYIFDDNHNTRYNYDWYNYEYPSKNAFNTPSDFSYALDFDWDYDKDGFAGEFQEIKSAKLSKKIQTRFLLGRIPFSNLKDIGQVLENTIAFEKSQSENSNVLIASGIIGYPETKKFPLLSDGAYYANKLSVNLNKRQLENVTLYELGGLMPTSYKSTYPLSVKKFNEELNKQYDMTYTFGHGGYRMHLWEKDLNKSGFCEGEYSEYDILSMPTDGLLTGFLYLDGCHTMRVEADSDYSGTMHFQDLLKNGMTCAGVATTRDSSVNPSEPVARTVNYMFQNQSVILSQEFYSSLQRLITEVDLMWDAYIYVYIGDPTLRLYP